MDVIFKEGLLYMQGFKFGKRTWRKVWMVLFKASSTGVGRLEFSTVPDNNATTDQKKIARQKTSERKVVRLSDCLSVTDAPKESCPSGCTAFYLNTTQSSYTLASTATQDWLSALCLLAFQKDPGESDKGVFDRGNDLTMEDNDLYSSWKTERALPPNQYHVTVHSTEASRRCQLAGEYLVSPEKQAVVLLDINTGHIIYRWPYMLLRKFGQVEGGFSIEAGRRCDSGEGVFIFLSRHGLQIFQTILNECSIDTRGPIQPPSVHRRSLIDQSPVSFLPNIPNQLAAPPAFPAADVPSDTDGDDPYSTINDGFFSNTTHLSNSEEAVGEEGEEEGELCYSLGAVNLDDCTEDYLRRATPPVARKSPFHPGGDGPDCIYSNVKKVHPPSNSQSFSPPLPPSVPQPPPFILPPPSFAPPKPRYQRPPTVNNHVQPGFNAQAQAVDETKEMEEATGSPTQAMATETPGSFKHRLAEIFSKDLAKFHPLLPSGVGSSTVSQ